MLVKSNDVYQLWKDTSETNLIYSIQDFLYNFTPCKCSYPDWVFGQFQHVITLIGACLQNGRYSTKLTHSLVDSIGELLDRSGQGQMPWIDMWDSPYCYLSLKFSRSLCEYLILINNYQTQLPTDLTSRLLKGAYLEKAEIYSGLDIVYQEEDHDSINKYIRYRDMSALCQDIYFVLTKNDAVYDLS